MSDLFGDNGFAELPEGERLGMLVSGSLSKGFEVKVDGGTALEALAVGRYVAIQGKRYDFFGLVTDVALQATDQRLATAPPDVSNAFVAEVMAGTAAYGSIHVAPYLAIDPTALSEEERVRPVKTVPPHFSPVRAASEREMGIVFGQEDSRHFWVGSPLDMDTKVCLDYRRFVERSNGVFGKSGTGKTFLAYILLASLIQKGPLQDERRWQAVNLVFDMHNEYGWAGRSEAAAGSVKGLKQVFGSRVAIFSLDDESSRRRGVSPDGYVRAALTDIEPEDVAILRDTLNLTELAVSAAFALERHFKNEWLVKLLDEDATTDVDEAAQKASIHQSSLSSLKRGMERLSKMAFVSDSGVGGTIDRIREYLNRGINVVIEFGRHGDDLAAYILVANLITRRIHDEYRQRVEAAMGDRSQEPRHLVITIEEAHKFLSPAVAGQTIFGTIARELRKYNVTLLVIDQRPSGIDEEVMSQIGTKVACLLDNEKDVEAVLAGVSGRQELRNVLARLESKQQALIFGHAVPLPVVVRTRDYGTPESYRAFGAEADTAQAERDAEALWG